MNIFFVVRRGNPSDKSKCSCLPNTLIVPVPVRSSLPIPFSIISFNKFRYPFSEVIISVIYQFPFVRSPVSHHVQLPFLCSHSRAANHTVHLTIDGFHLLF